MKNVQIGNVQVAFLKQRPIEDCKEYVGFKPGRTILPAGYVSEEGRRPFPVETVFDRDVTVVLRDGTKIYVDIFRPNNGEKVPAILTWGSAGKGGMNNMLDHITDGPVFGMPIDPDIPPRLGLPKDVNSGMQAWECIDPAYWVKYGYAVVNADPRGIYMSEGDAQYFGEQDAMDLYDTVEALSAMDWCSGSVGTSGCSWYGMVQHYAAHLKPPHLKAIATLEGHGDLYREEYVKGGIPIDTTMKNERTYSNGYMEEIYTMVDRYPLFNEYWQGKMARFEENTIPAYMTGCFSAHIHGHGDIDAYNRTAAKEKWLRIHNTQEWVDLWDDSSNDDLRKFFDYYLKGIDNGWKDTPPVRMSVFDFEGEDIVNRPEEKFPPERRQLVPYYINAASGKLEASLPEKAASASYDSENEEILYFTVDITEEMETTGYFKAKLWVESESYDDMDIFVRVTQLAADGSMPWHNACFYKYTGPDGRLRVSHRRINPEKSTPDRPYHDHTEQEMLKKGEIVPVEIELWPTAMKWHKGQKLLFTIAGYDYCPYAPGDRPKCRPDNKGRHIIHTGGQYDSHLLIPIIK